MWSKISKDVGMNAVLQRKKFMYFYFIYCSPKVSVFHFIRCYVVDEVEARKNFWENLRNESSQFGCLADLVWLKLSHSNRLKLKRMEWNFLCGGGCDSAAAADADIEFQANKRQEFFQFLLSGIVVCVVYIT